jgi:Zn-dependent protease with chaperone function
MARAAALYPPSPTRLPEGLTVPGRDYKFRVFLVLASLVLFFVLYLSLLIGSGVLTVVLVLFFRPAVVGILFGVCSGLFFLFLVNGLFKSRPVVKEAHVEIFEKEHPRLFAFLRRLCTEINAPFPHRVFLSYEVNAAVFYEASLASLFRRSPKNLLIGVGLLNMLNLSEFKAVLAHEFGHFTQNSMKVNAYAYTANRIIADLVSGHDWLDDLVARWCRSDNVLASGFGWAVWGVQACFRKVLEGFYFAINFLNFSLSRRMEFNADLVAVSVTGSDAVVNTLLRSEFANEALMQSFHELAVAADHQLYSWDLFVHQTRAAGYLRRARKDPLLGERPPALPADATVLAEVFSRDEDVRPPMWAAHPSNYDREHNVKRRYVHCPPDERSPWVLFDNTDELRERVTWKFYRVEVKLKRTISLADPAEVQAFIDDEHAETTYDPRYQGVYDDRFINPGDVEQLAQSARAEPLSRDALARREGGLYAGRSKERMEQYALLREELDTLTGLQNGRLKLKGDTFTFRARRYGLDDVERLLEKVQWELDEDLDSLAELDRRVFACHYQMALEVGGPAAQELLDRYRFHLALQGLAARLLKHEKILRATLAFLARGGGMSVDQFVDVRDDFREAHEALAQCLNAANKMPMPELKNMKAGEPVGAFLLSKELLPQFGYSAQGLTGKKIGRFLRQMGEVQDKLHRIHFKSLGAILALQERVAARWQGGRPGPVATAVAVEAESARPAAPADPKESPVVLIPLTCPGCRTQHDVPDSLQGRRVVCRECGEAFVVRGPRRGSLGDDEIVRGSKTKDDNDPFASKPLGRSRSDDEIAERTVNDGPGAEQLVGAFAAALIFLVLLGTLTFVFWTRGPAPAPQAASAPATQVSGKAPPPPVRQPRRQAGPVNRPVRKPAEPPPAKPNRPPVEDNPPAPVREPAGQPPAKPNPPPVVAGGADVRGKDCESLPAWGQVIDPDGDCRIQKDGDKVTMTVPGRPHDLSARRKNAPRILREMEGDFTVRVKVTGEFDPGTDPAAAGTVSFHGAGLLVWDNADNFLRLERNQWYTPQGQAMQYPPLLEYWKDNRAAFHLDPTQEPYFKGRSTHLKLERRGRVIQAFVSHDGVRWLPVRTLATAFPGNVRVGVAAVNTSRRPFTVEFEDFVVRAGTGRP